MVETESTSSRRAAEPPKSIHCGLRCGHTMREFGLGRTSMDLPGIPMKSVAASLLPSTTPLSRAPLRVSSTFSRF